MTGQKAETELDLKSINFQQKLTLNPCKYENRIK